MYMQLAAVLPPIMTATGVKVADVEEVIFTDVVDGKLKAFRPNEEILMCDISETAGDAQDYGRLDFVQRIVVHRKRTRG